MSLNLLTDKWITLPDGSKTTIDDILNMPHLNFYGTVAGYHTATIIFMLLKSYLDEVNEEDFLYFMQAPYSAFSSSAKEVSIDQLVYTQPRENTKKRNADFFVKQGSVKCLCEACATQSLFFTSLFGGACGQGYSPSQFSGSLIAFRSGNTVGEIINNNRINKKYSFEQLFSTPYKVRFINDGIEECSLCGDKILCYTHFLREPNDKIVQSDNFPLVVKTDKNSRLYFKKYLTEIQLLGKINNSNIVLPDNIGQLNVKDNFNIFSVMYDKAKLVDIIDSEIEYSEININNHIWFLSEQIKTFRKEKTDELEYNIAVLLEGYLKYDDLNASLMKVFQNFIPDDITALSETKIQFLATAINRVRERYES